MWWKRPWRWLYEMLAAAVVLGLLNMIGKWLGASPYLGIPTAARIALFIGLTLVLEFVVVPSPRKMDRGDPLPPLPTHEAQAGRRGWGSTSSEHR